MVQAGHALQRGTADKPQSSNALEPYLLSTFNDRSLADSTYRGSPVLRDVQRRIFADTVFSVGTHFHDNLPNVLGVETAQFRIRLKNKAAAFGPALALPISSGGDFHVSHAC